MGINNPGTLSSSVQILPNSSYAELCFVHSDDNITCEAPIIGNVRLLSSPVVAVGNPSSAQVTVMDDDGKCDARPYVTLVNIVINKNIMIFTKILWPDAWI